MPAPAHIARENGKKGGRPKGSVAKSTLEALKAKEELIKAYLDNIKPINKALIEKAKEGDMQAIKELHDRVYGKAVQPIEGDLKATLEITFDPVFKQK